MATPKKPLQHDLKTEDDWLAADFLEGWGQIDSILISRRYFQKGADLEARRALIRILRSDKPISRTLRNYLAELFEIKSSVAKRRLEFIFRKDRKRSNSMAQQQISHFVALKLKELAGQPKAKSRAISLAADHFGMTTKQIYEHKKSPPVGRKG
jgi:hypothetical protein